MRGQWAFIVAVLAAVGTGQARQTDTVSGDAKAVESTPVEELTNAQIAERYMSAMRGCATMRVTFAQSDGRTAVAGWSIMEPGSVRTVVWVGAPRRRPLCSLSSRDGRVVEIRPVRNTGKYKTLAYDALDEAGTAQSPESEAIDCLWGSNTASWIGQHGDNIGVIGERISIGTREQDQDVVGRPCYVVKWQDTAENGLIVAQRFYVDKKSFLILRIDGWQTFEGETITRIRHNRYRADPLILPEEWNVDAGDFDLARLDAVLNEIQVKDSPGLELITLRRDSKDTDTERGSR